MASKRKRRGRALAKRYGGKNLSMVLADVDTSLAHAQGDLGMLTSEDTKPDVKAFASETWDRLEKTRHEVARHARIAHLK